MLLLLSEKFPVNCIKARDIKKLVNYSRRFLFDIHYILDEHFKQKFDTFTKEYLKELLKKMIDKLNQSTSWSDWQWKRVEFNVKHTGKNEDLSNLDELARKLIAKISKVMALTRYQKQI